MKIKRGDKVVVISGKDRGKSGKVLRVDSKKARVVVEGVNIVHKHKKSLQQGMEGGIITREAAIHVSNVALYSEKLSRGVRVSYGFLGADNKVFNTENEAFASLNNPDAKVRKVRYSRKTGEIF